MEMIKKSPEVDRLVGHSLASAVINKINQEQPTKVCYNNLRYTSNQEEETWETKPSQIRL